MFISKTILICFVYLLISCENSTWQTENVDQSRSKEKPELSLKMERFGCYGRCPIYDLTIQPDGKVVFDGKFWTKITGRAEDKLTENQLKELTTEIEKVNFFLLDNSYDWKSSNCPSLATDMPSVSLTIKLNGNEKTVNHYHGCFENDTPKDNEFQDLQERIYPQNLYRLENKIDEIVGTKRWVGEEK